MQHHLFIGLRGGTHTAKIELQHADEKFAQFIYTFGQFRRLGAGDGIVLEQLRPVVAHHASAGTGRHDHGPRLRKQVELGAGHGARLFRIAAAVGGLAAAALAARIMHQQAFPLQQTHRVEARLRHEQVDEAGGEQVHLWRWRWIVA